MSAVNKLQVSIGLLALLVGMLFYLINRPWDTYFLSLLKDIAGTPYWDPPFFRTIGGVLPSFLHVFAFALLTGGLLGCAKLGYLILCCAWLLVNVLFEVGQAQAVAIMVSQAIPQWFEGVFILENIEPYFVKGTFDVFDLSAAFFGALAAYWLLVLTKNERRVL